jgi:DNA polymerase-3 subunit epsilon
MLDRQISVHEANSLVQLAESHGISRTTCQELHLHYLNEVVKVAWADGVLAADEIADLAGIAKLLSIPDALLLTAMRPPVDSVAASADAHFALVAGDLIVLTGEMLRPRDDWFRIISDHGYVPWTAVTKKVRLVAAADPDSLSGKARKARDYGIPVVDEAWLEHMMS